MALISERQICLFQFTAMKQINKLAKAFLPVYGRGGALQVARATGRHRSQLIRCLVVTAIFWKRICPVTGVIGQTTVRLRVYYKGIKLHDAGKFKGPISSSQMVQIPNQVYLNSYRISNIVLSTYYRAISTSHKDIDTYHKAITLDKVNFL